MAPMMSKSNTPFHHDSYSSLPYLSLQSADLLVGQAPPTARWDLSVPIYTLTIFKIYLHSGTLSTWLRRTPLVRTRDRGFGGKPPSGFPGSGVPPMMPYGQGFQRQCGTIEHMGSIELLFYNGVQEVMH